MAPRAPREPRTFSLSPRAVLLETDARGLPTDALLKRSGLSREEIWDPEGWVPLRRHALFYREAVAASGDPATFWAGVGARALIQAALLPGHAAGTSATVREALETWGRFSTLVVDLLRIEVKSTPDGDRFSLAWPDAYASLFQDVQVSGLIAFRRFVTYAAGPVRPIRAFLARAAPPSDHPIEEALGAPCHWGAEWPTLVFPPGTFDRPLSFASPAMHEMLVEAAQRRLEMQSTRSASDRVRAAILDLGFDRSSKVAAVAAALETTSRSLQRWLADESKTFSRVRSEALADAAVEMFREEGATVATVAFRLGFSSRNAFHRAIRRWTGKTPGELSTRRKTEWPT